MTSFSTSSGRESRFSNRVTGSGKIVFVVGPTATGKTTLGVHLARCFQGEIISADSRQVYRGMDIGTGKDLRAYGEGPDRVPYHLIDIVNPEQEFNLFRYLEEFSTVYQDIRLRGRLPIVTGGTPLYLKALLENYEMPGSAPDPGWRGEAEEFSDHQLRVQLQQLSPDLYSRTDLTQRRRLIRAVEIARGHQCRHKAADRPEKTATDAVGNFEPLIIAPFFPRNVVHQRIEIRLQERLQEGLLAEVERLHEEGVSWQRLESFGLEYLWSCRFLKGEIDYEHFRSTLLARIRRFCKSQDCWYRKFERDGWDIHWLAGGDQAAARVLVEAFLQGKSVPSPRIRMNDIRYGPQSNRS